MHIGLEEITFRTLCAWQPRRICRLSTGTIFASWYSMYPITRAHMQSDIITQVTLRSYSILAHSQNFFKIEKHCESNSCKYIELAKKDVCGDTAHLEKFLQDVMDKGGEGVILRDPRSLYHPGRSPGYLKHKVSNRPVLTKVLITVQQKFRDAEAKIVGSAGMCQWECEL